MRIGIGRIIFKVEICQIKVNLLLFVLTYRHRVTILWANCVRLVVSKLYVLTDCIQFCTWTAALDGEQSNFGNLSTLSSPKFKNISILKLSYRISVLNVSFYSKIA